MKMLPSTLPQLAIACWALFSAGCYSTDPEFGGATSLLNGDAPSKLLDVLEAEPPPVRPDNHMDPVEESHGAVSVQFGEDLRKTAAGPDR